LLGLALLCAACGGQLGDASDPGVSEQLSGVTSLTLVNATTGQPIAGFDPIPSGATLTLSTLPTQQLSIRANATGVGSVKFVMDGAAPHVESYAPYSLCGDATTTYTPCPSLDAVGSHTLTVTPYSGANATGTAGPALTLPFSVQQTAAKGASVTGLSLMSAVTHLPIAGFDPMANGAQINLAALPTSQLYIQATTSPATVGNVVFTIDASPPHTEGLAPYDACGDYVACPQLAVAGAHTVTATPHNSVGVAGTPLTITFTTLVATSSPHTYSTNFASTENPISEGGNWVGGQAAGGLWGNVRTLGGLATGVSQPNQFGDPTAILTGTWNPNQTASAVVKIVTTPTGAHEVEVRVRATVSANSITGYEFLCPVFQNPNYTPQIVRWNGPNGKFVVLSGAPAHQCVNGDVLMLTATGTNPVTLSAYINGALVQTVQDHGTETGPYGGAAGPWASGNPGIGFYDGSDGNWSYFGLSSFSAHEN
jgi:hypothetical protein